ncbi:hypothetical protein J3A83DRAFT_4397976, partial [Scleroderma citrinum]
MSRTPKKNRATAPRSSDEDIRPHETASTSEVLSIFMKGKAKLKHIRDRISRNTVPKEVTAHDERTGAVVVDEQANGQRNELGGSALNNRVKGEGSPALPQHNQPTTKHGPTAVAENIVAVVHETSAVSAHPGDAQVQKDKGPATDISAVAGDDQVIQTVPNHIYDAERKILTVESIPRPA